MKTFRRSPASLFTSLLLAASLGAGLTLTGQTHAQSAQADSSAKMAAHAKAQYPTLSRYATDLTRLARQGRLEALAGHDAEIKRAAQLLSEDARRNPVLVTESSLNASQFAQALAMRIATGDAPESLRSKRLFSLNLDALSKDAKTPEEFAARLQSVLAETLAAKGEVILFVNGLEQFVGAHANTAVSNSLRDALASNQLQVVGSASPEAFAEINADATLSPLFQQIRMSEAKETQAEKRDEVKKNTEEFEGDKVSADLREMMASASSRTERVSVILQADDVKDEELMALLKKDGVLMGDRMQQIGAMKVEVPVKAIEELAANNHTRHLSVDREVSLLGHVTATTGADAVRNPQSGSLLGSLLGSNTIDGTGINIAIIDSGMDVAHRAFTNTNGRIKFKKDFTTEGKSDKDPYGHGTHVAAAAGGVSTTNGDSYSGIAPGIGFINLRVLNAQGTGSTASLLSALNWILSPADPTLPASALNPLNKDKYNIRVVNMSLGAPAIDSYKNDPVCRAVRQLVDNGIVVVAAAGNNGKDANGNKIYGQIHSPGNEPSVITVGATNSFGTNKHSDDTIATYSSRGPTRSFTTDANGVKVYDNLVKPDLVAPGNKLIYAEADDGENNPNLIVKQHPELDSGITDNDNKKLMYLSGTSMATPVVSGAVAMMLQINPKLTPSMVKMMLMYTADPVKGFNMLEQGTGQLNIEGAARLAKLVRTDLTNSTAVGSNLLTTTTVPTQTTTINGETFDWARGIVAGSTYATGTNLITKYQKVYGTGSVLGDGIFLGDGIYLSDASMMSDGIFLGDKILTSDGIFLGDGGVFCNGIFLGDGIFLSDGIFLGDGILQGDGIFLSDGIFLGDSVVQAQSAMVGGDNGPAMPAIP